MRSHWTDEEFDALAALMRLRIKTSASSRALRAVLVCGASIDQAAAENRIHKSHVEDVIVSAKECLRRAKALQEADLIL